MLRYLVVTRYVFENRSFALIEHGRHAQPFLAAGGILWTLSMLLCIFATELWHFFVIMVCCCVPK